MTAGLLAHEVSPIDSLPTGRLVSGSRQWPGGPGVRGRHMADRLSAYSCGGSHGIGPIWVTLTVFPINSLGVLPQETVTTNKADSTGECKKTL